MTCRARQWRYKSTQRARGLALGVVKVATAGQSR
jgi:hypothetical protein